jgi:hypothetical protein
MNNCSHAPVRRIASAPNPRGNDLKKALRPTGYACVRGVTHAYAAAAPGT